MTRYRPHIVKLGQAEIAAICTVLASCPACNVMCVRNPVGGHVHYTHVHQNGRYAICIYVSDRHHPALPGAPLIYQAFVSDTQTATSHAVPIPIGYYPVGAVSSARD
ncbi:hypothetical protein ONZ51_g7555 [Trametes cubensis]|uniref:Uncharacterized protein n=1 Tax=Trametes cubensis TaxID=1111947 RepID=A0AAD7XBM8_9APHY|nr:hypothetical protein ONZ51_g7555 [Trametes cubensis]